METDNLPKISEDLFTLMWRLGSTFFKKDKFKKVTHFPPSQVKLLFHLMHLGPFKLRHQYQSPCIPKPIMTPIIDNPLTEGFASGLKTHQKLINILIEKTKRT